MTQVKAQEITKAAGFLSSVNNLINGKFILADVKIAEVLQKINDSEELFNFVSRALIGFNFEKELRKSEIKNRFNGGEFKLPNTEKEIVALVFCLLVEFDSKKIDFYEFIKENFPTSDNKGDQKLFSNTILVPFRNAVAKHFNLSKEDEDNKEIVKDLKPQIEQEEKEEKEEEILKVLEKNREDELFEEIDKLSKHLYKIIEGDPKIKQIQKEDLLFVLKGIIYSGRYKDIKILNSLLVSFEHLSKKVVSIKFVYGDLKRILLDYYKG